MKNFKEPNGWLKTHDPPIKLVCKPTTLSGGRQKNHVTPSPQKKFNANRNRWSVACRAVKLKKNIDQGKVTGTDQFSVVGCQAVPVFTEMILDAVTEISSSCDIVYVHSMETFRFNFLHSRMVDKRLVVPKHFYEKSLKADPWLVDKSLLRNELVRRETEKHLIRWLDFLSNKFENLRFLFLVHYLRYRFGKKDRVVNYEILHTRYPGSLDFDRFFNKVETPFEQAIKSDQMHMTAETEQLFVDHLKSLARGSSPFTRLG